MSLYALRAATLALACLPACAAAAPLSLNQALELAVQRSEATRAARAGANSAAESAQAAGQLPDPMLRAGVENLPIAGADRFSTARDFQTMKRIGISQEWLSRDKRAARRAAAEAAVTREVVQAQAAAADARLQTALAYLDAHFAGELLQLTTLTEHHVHEELEAARARLASSTGGSMDVLALTASRGTAEDESAAVRQQLIAARVALQRWVGMPADDLAAMPALPAPAEQAYVDAAPAVMALQRELDLARAVTAAVATERQPNWTWELSYGQRTGYADMVSVGLSVPLQLSPTDRQDRDTAAKQALVEKAQAELVEAVRTATAEYRALASEAQGSLARIERFRSGVLIPSRQRTAAALAAYRSNQAPLTSLFEARHQEVDMSRKLLMLQRDLARTQAQLAFKPLMPGDAP
jgi:outer membrane protein TolC